MNLEVLYDPDASQVSQKLVFSREKYELSREDIAMFKKKKYIKYIEPEDFPDIIVCQVLIYCDNFKKATINFFNPMFDLPEEVFENQFLNKDIIEQCSQNGGFRLGFNIPLTDKAIKFNFSYNTEEK